MREIKFRAKLLISGELKYFNLTDLHTLDDGVTYAHCIGIDLDTVQEYIGLKDKNGVEAYEGDLYFFSRYSKYPAEIYWDDRWCGWRGRVNGEMQFDKTYSISPLKFGEIVGNIIEGVAPH